MWLFRTAESLSYDFRTILHFADVRPPSLHDHGLQVNLQTRTIMASKCISKVARSQPSSVSLTLHDHGLQVYLQSRSIMAFKLAPTLPWSASLSSLNHGVVELEGMQPIINTPPHVAWHPMGISEKERFELEGERIGRDTWPR